MFYSPLPAHPWLHAESVTKQHDLLIILYPGKDMKIFAYYQIWFTQHSFQSCKVYREASKA